MKALQLFVGCFRACEAATCQKVRGSYVSPTNGTSHAHIQEFGGAVELLAVPKCQSAKGLVRSKAFNSEPQTEATFLHFVVPQP